MAPDEARVLHEVRRPDRPRPEAQVRDRLRARLLRVVDEVPLRVQALAEDLDRVLVRADRPVRAEPEEHRADGVRRLDVQGGVVGQARPRHVVVDADREAGPRPLARELREHAGDHPGRELLRREAVAAADHPRHDLALAVHVRLAERGDHVEEQRLAERAGLLGAVQHRDPPHARGQRGDQGLGRERPVQAHLHHADALAALVERGHGLADGLRAGAHHDHHPLGVRVPGVLDDVQSGVRCARRDGPSRPGPRPARGRRTGFTVSRAWK